jgi:hypothetical protein
MGRTTPDPPPRCDGFTALREALKQITEADVEELRRKLPRVACSYCGRAGTPLSTCEGCGATVQAATGSSAKPPTFPTVKR